jgi:hypothetical protein
MTDVLLHGSDEAGNLPFSLVAGDNRVLVVFHTREVNDTAALTAVDIDGVSGHIFAQDTVGTMNVYGYYWLESELTAAFVQGAAINKTGADDSASGMLCAVLLQNAPQTAPTDFYAISQNATGTLNYTLDEVDGGLGLLFAANSKTTGTWTFNGGYAQLGSNHNDGTNTQAVLATKAPAADTTDTVTAVQNSLTGDKLGLIAVMFGPSPAPSRGITDIDGDNDVYPGQTGVVVEADALELPIASVTLGDQALTVTSENAGDPIVTIPLNINLEWNVAHQLIVTDNVGALTFATTVALSAPSGWDWIAYDGNAQAEDVGFVAQALADLGITVAAGDKFAIEKSTGMTVAVDGSTEIDPAATVTGSYKVWDASAGSFSAVSTYTFTDGGLPDAPDQLVSIDSLTPARTTSTVEFSYPGADVTSFEYSLDGTNWLAATSPLTLSALSEATQYTLRIRPLLGSVPGSVISQTFTTLSAIDITPNPFSFASQTGVALNDMAVSNAITVLGVDAGVDIPVSITNGRYSVSTNGGQTWGAATSSTTNVSLNYQVRVEHDTPGTYITPTVTSIDIGGTVAAFNSTTLDDAVAPEITLTGGDRELIVGDAWSEPGYLATDNADGNITGNVIITGSVDTSTPGTYSLTYYVEDAAGNSTTVTRNVLVSEEVLQPDITADFIPSLLSTNTQEVTVFKGRGNRFRVELSHEGLAIDLSMFTRFELYGLTEQPIDSDASSALDWDDGNGVLNVDVGEVATASGSVKTTLVGYFSEYSEGVVLWHPSLAQAHVTVNLVNA